ncbi:MAG TPA: hypothetical protein VJ955_05975 [Desulfuromonadales bacterium]|nr:hypothetical protein [Desulfuromonadales bacterium]
MNLIADIKDRWFGSNEGGSPSPFAIGWPFKHSRFLVHATGKIRRFMLVHFRKKYVDRQLILREGDCRQCGTCCDLLFTCPMLSTEGRCFVYGSCRPQACKAFPIDQRDITEAGFCGAQCGFRFPNERAKDSI